MSRRTNSATSRLRQDYLRLKRDPVPYIVAEPLPSNLLEWHYVVQGPEKSPYAGGVYHGKLVFPPEFPFKPPSIYMLTPNGRFEVNTRLCLSISDYHPDTWNPAWSVSTILTGLLSFMLETQPTLGSVEMSEARRKQLATQSHAHNLKVKLFRELFPEQAEKSRALLDKRLRQEQQQQPDALAAARKQTGGRNLGGVGSAGGQDIDGPDAGGGLQAAITNALVIGGFAAFAFVVQYVLQTIAATE